MLTSQTGTIKATVRELEALTGYNPATLSVLLRVAQDNGVARIVGSVAKPEKTKGKPASIWELDESFTFSWIKKGE